MPIVRFKSIPYNYQKEYSGVKNNTVRILDKPTDERSTILRMASTHSFCQYLEVEIINTETGDSFKRRVKDVTFFRPKGLPEIVIISW